MPKIKCPHCGKTIDMDKVLPLDEEPMTTGAAPKAVKKPKVKKTTIKKPKAKKTAVKKATKKPKAKKSVAKKAKKV